MHSAQKEQLDLSHRVQVHTCSGSQAGDLIDLCEMFKLIISRTKSNPTTLDVETAAFIGMLERNMSDIFLSDHYWFHTSVDRSRFFTENFRIHQDAMPRFRRTKVIVEFNTLHTAAQRWERVGSRRSTILRTMNPTDSRHLSWIGFAKNVKVFQF